MVHLVVNDSILIKLSFASTIKLSASNFKGKRKHVLDQGGGEVGLTARLCY